MKVGDRFLGTSIIGTEFDCRIDSKRSFGRRTGISPIIYLG
jgi:proline racemase